MKVQLKTTLGDIVLELDAVRAPNTAANFVDYVREGFYDGTLFHRVIDGFMVQGGGFLPGMQRKPTRAPIVNEADNGLRNVLGSIAMARTPDPHSASSQFFINVVDNAFLDFKAKNDNGWGYCVFGRVVEGMDVVGRIKAVSTTTRAGNRDVPVEDVVIEQATMLED
jgi:peptidyl-prolyl cis-trans isomerase B (cyclophilin B)